METRFSFGLLFHFLYYLFIKRHKLTGQRGSQKLIDFQTQTLLRGIRHAFSLSLIIILTIHVTRWLPGPDWAYILTGRAGPKSFRA